jgi:3-oxoacyl-[acyl-carrier-protein] synthase-3
VTARGRKCYVRDAMLNLLGLGHFHPENVIDNAFLESLDIGTNDEWIMKRVGIRSRRTVLPLDYIRDTRNQDPRASDEAAEISNPQSGARAASMAIQRAGIQPSDIGLVVVGGCSPRWLAPAEASMVANELGIEVPALDMHAACSTFGMQLHFLAQMHATLPDYVLCVCLENNTRVVDYNDRSTAILWGDGSAAAVVSARHRGKARVLGSTFGGSPAGANDVVIPRVGFFSQDGARVHKFAVKRMTTLLREYQHSAAEIVYVGHQANLTMLRSVAKRAGLAPENHWYNIDAFGNQGSAGAPCVLSQRWDEIEEGTRVAVVVVGSGLSWSSVLLQF